MIQKADNILEPIDRERDKAFIQMLSNPDTKSSLQLMGDPESEYSDVSTFSVGSQDDQVSWAVRQNDRTIGIAWISQETSDDVSAPSLHVAIEGDEKTLITAVNEMIRYAYRHLPYATLYVCHLAKDTDTAPVYKKLGFEKDGDAYEDEFKQKWQNYALML